MWWIVKCLDLEIKRIRWIHLSPKKSLKEIDNTPESTPIFAQKFKMMDFVTPNKICLLVLLEGLLNREDGLIVLPPNLLLFILVRVTLVRCLHDHPADMNKQPHSLQEPSFNDFVRDLQSDCLDADSILEAMMERVRRLGSRLILGARHARKSGRLWGFL